MTELFDEVDEDLRREQLARLWKKHGWLILTVATLIVAAVGGWRGYQYFEAQKAAAAGASFEAAATLADQNKHSEAEAAFARIATEGSAGYRALARLRAAAEAAARDPQGAVKLYDGIAADGSLGQDFQDIANLRAAGLLLDKAAYAEIRQRLEAAAGTGRSFRHSARELLALSALRGKDSAAAKQWIDAISVDDQTPSSLRQRVEALQALLPPAAKG